MGGEDVDQGINRKRSEQLINLSRGKYLRVLQYDATQFYICFFFWAEVNEGWRGQAAAGRMFGYSAGAMLLMLG